jgi:hypothetical protein
MDRTKVLLMGVIALSVVLALTDTQAQPILLAPLPRPDGITTDPAGNLWVVADATFARILVVLAPDGRLLAQLPLPGTSIADTGTHNLLYDPVLGGIWDLKSSGELMLINPNTGAGGTLLDIRALPVDISAVYDVASGILVPMGNIVPQVSIYGDLAVLWRGELLDLFVSGRSVVHPFVMRIRFVQGNFTSARVLISTLAPESAANQPRGVAVDPRGVVLTTVPIASFGEAIYAWAADFPEAVSTPPSPVLDGVLSAGMTTDGQGNFYVAGFNVVCSGDVNALLILFAGLTGGRCLPSAGGLFGSGRDVAVSPTLPTAYTTTGQGVLAWPLGAPAARALQVIPSHPR